MSEKNGKSDTAEDQRPNDAPAAASDKDPVAVAVERGLSDICTQLSEIQLELAIQADALMTCMRDLR